MINILLIHDLNKDPLYMKTLLLNQKKIKFQTLQQNNIKNTYFLKNHYDIIVLDLSVDEKNSLILCKEIRKYNSCPLVLLSSEKEEIYELFAFEIGFDEYIRKPFNRNIFFVRLMALIRRNPYKQKMNYLNSELYINRLGRLVCINGKPVDLRPKEYNLLIYLIDNKGIALSRDSILRQVWDYDFSGYHRTVDSHIKKIRKKMGCFRECIKTIHNFGYKFVDVQ